MTIASKFFDTLVSQSAPLPHSTGVGPCTYCGTDLDVRSVCRGCRSPLIALDFPQYYFDLGGES